MNKKPTPILTFLILIVTLPLLLVILYKVKTKLGINIIQTNEHTPVAIQKLTGLNMSWIDTNWFRKQSS